jgi:serine/threonine-protein kinase HipA
MIFGEKIVNKKPANLPQPNSLDVYAAKALAGSLYRSDVVADTFLFAYEVDLAAEHATSITMPVVRDVYDAMSIVHPIFEMNLPEGALLERLRLQFAKVVEDFDSLTLLGIVGQSQVGRIRYAQRGAPLLDIPDQDMKAIVTHRSAEEFFESLLRKYAVHSGLSGVQPKVLVRASAGTDGRLTHRGATHIVKSFDPKQYPGLANNEHICMRAAKRAGIATASTQVSNNGRLLIVDRFDVTEKGDYLGIEDFCVLSGLRAHGRYEGSYERLAKRVRDFVSSAEQAKSLRQLFRMVAFASAIENGDAHLKNFAVVYETPERAITLAPAYDLISTTPYVPKDVMALTIGDSKAFPQRAQLLAFGQRDCLLAPQWCERALDHIASSLTQAADDVRHCAAHNKSFGAVGKRMLDAFARGAARIG